MINENFVPVDREEYEIIITKINDEYIHLYAFNLGHFSSKSNQSWHKEKIVSLLKAIDNYDKSHTNLGYLVVDAQEALSVPIIGYFKKISAFVDIQTFKPIDYNELRLIDAA